MPDSNFIIDVSEVDFEYEVIAYSNNTPVVVDFWAEWCKPCKQLSPILESIANESNGIFRLARVDIETNPNLALRYSVRSLPVVKAFSQGQIVAEFSGLIPPARVQDFIGGITPPGPLALDLEKADSLLFLHQWQDAGNLYHRILDQNPENPGALLGMVKIQIHQNKPQNALEIINRFPASRLFPRAQVLLPLIQALVNQDSKSLPGENDLDITFNRCIRLTSRGNLPAALDGLLEVLRLDRHYRDERARLVFLAILELMGEDDPQNRQYRSELASVLFG